jgi:hypothetical protein
MFPNGAWGISYMGLILALALHKYNYTII